MKPTRASRIGALRPRPFTVHFVLKFAFLLAVFNGCYYLVLARSHSMRDYLALNARVTAAVARAWDTSVRASGQSVASNAFQLSIEDGCDAVQSSALLAIAVLASPFQVRWERRLIFILGGVLFLSVVNILRIVSLFYVGAYFPRAFEFMHVDFWQAVFIFLPLSLWLGWVYGIKRTQGHSAGAPRY